MPKKFSQHKLEDEYLLPDSRSLAAPDPQRWSGIIRCECCGREVREDWTPEQSPETRLCARCLEMVRDPDTRKE